MNRSNDRSSDIEDTLRIQTTLYDLVEATGSALGAGKEHLITNVLLDLANARLLRPSQRWARIMFVPAVEKSPVAAGSITATGPGGSLDEQVAILA
jgi:hypothetical protein